ncbi:hypothetical protein PHMEG_00028968 [Phytophthora megakarya]|uniref:Uncharacterized protein n=1 Tax=Phytophthora megakarya TaxID=4795 RepID=A0A225V3T6_9STRA|nr:hypothetical protein PHMEG_00028968 [Phytophthora megakarya]
MTLAHVSIKIGAITKTSRTNVSIESPTFVFSEETDTFIAIKEISSSSDLQAKTIRTDPTIYLKASLGAKQAEWVALSTRNWRHNVEVAKSHYNKRKKTTGPFTLELFVFADRDSNGVGIRRATSGRIEEAARSIDSYLLERSDISVGPIALSYWETTHARQPDGTEPSLPTNATFRQMQHLDSIRAKHQPVYSDPQVRTLTVQLNGRRPHHLCKGRLRCARIYVNSVLLSDFLSITYCQRSVFKI